MSTYEHCQIGKKYRISFEKGTSAEFILQLIHSDISGPLNMRPKHGVLILSLSLMITFDMVISI